MSLPPLNPELLQRWKRRLWGELTGFGGEGLLLQELGCPDAKVTE